MVFKGGIMVKGDKRAKNMVKNGAGPLGFVFFTAWIGALVYFVQHSEGVGGFIVAVLKSFVWPAYVVHAVLGLLKL